MVQATFTAKKWQQTESSLLISGKDPGAGFGKAIYGGSSIILPSAYLLHKNRNERQVETISTDGCWIRYVEGDRKDLTNTEYFWGMAAINKDPKNYVKLHEDTKAKALYALESTLADAAVLDLPDGSDIFINLSSHNPDKWSGDICRNVGGTHTFEHLKPDVNRNLVRKTLNITISNVYPEGYGSIAYCLFSGDATASLDLNPSDIAIGLDWGTSTVIVSVFDGVGALIDRQAIEGGSGELYQRIADTMDAQPTAVNKLMRDTKPDVAIIRKGVEGYVNSQKFVYGASALVGRPFDDIYWQCFEKWIGEKIEKIANFVGGNDYLDRAKYLAAWGGAAQLPGMTEQLSPFNIIVLPNPQFINASGLKLLAQVQYEQ